jgi:hypothetical protein
MMNASFVFMISLLAWMWVDSSAGGSEPAGVAQNLKPNVPVRISTDKGCAGDDVGRAAHGRSRRPCVRETDGVK